MTSRQFFPFRNAANSISITVTVNGLEVAEGSQTRVPVYELDSPLVEVDIAALVPERVFQETLPADEQEKPPAEIVLVCQSVASHKRQSIRLSGVTAGRGQLSLKREEWFDRARIQALLVRTEDNASVPAGYAADRGSILAWSDEYELLFDEPPPPPFGGFIRIIWESFSASSADMLRNQPSSLFALNPAKDPPELYLNKDVEMAFEILDSKGTRGKKARIRDLTFQVIVHEVWSSLLGDVLLELREEMNSHTSAEPFELADTEMPAWKENIIKEWALKVCSDGQTTERAVEELFNVLGEPGGWGEIMMARVPRVLQEEHKLSDVFRNLVRETRDQSGG